MLTLAEQKGNRTKEKVPPHLPSWLIFQGTHQDTLGFTLQKIQYMDLKHRPTHYTYRILLVTENPGREAPSAHSSVDVNVREGLNLCRY